MVPNSVKSPTSLRIVVRSADQEEHGRRNPPDRRASALSGPRRQLLELMQDLGFGYLERLEIRAGEPVLDPPPRILRTIKLGNTTGVYRLTVGGDFVLKSQQIDLFSQFDHLQNGIIRRLDVQDGLPITIKVEEAAA